jgi:hypothetical protein
MGGCVSIAQAFAVGRLFLRVAAVDLASNPATLHPCLQRTASYAYQMSRRDIAEAQTAEG